MSEDKRIQMRRGDLVVCYARCWQCALTDTCPGGWHTWADPDDVFHAAATGQPDPSVSKCGCPCADGPVLDNEPEPDYDDVSIGGAICPICDAVGECGFDNDDRPWIHIYAEDDE